MAVKRRRMNTSVNWSKTNGEGPTAHARRSVVRRAQKATVQGVVGLRELVAGGAVVVCGSAAGVTDGDRPAKSAPEQNHGRNSMLTGEMGRQPAWCPVLNPGKYSVACVW